MGVEPTTTALATRCSTAELHPQNSGISAAVFARRQGAKLSNTPLGASRQKILLAEKGHDLNPFPLQKLSPTFFAVDHHQRMAY